MSDNANENNGYTKLSLKFRPRTLDEVFGQDSTVMQLKGMFKNNRISNVYLFKGKSGCGKTTISRIIYRYANCEDFDHEKVKPCGKCRSCTSDYSPDYFEVDGATNRGIDNVRDIQKLAEYSPQGKYRVILIDECHALTAQSMQSLLKILEDTPKETIFILCTTEVEKLPDTIVGRCKVLDIASLKEEDIVSLLSYICASEEMDDSIYNENLFRKIATYSKGHARNAITSLESVRDYVDGKEKIDNIEDIINEVNDNVLKSPEWQLAAKYLLSIFRGKYTGALRVVENVSNYEGFIRLLMEYTTQCIYWLVSDKLMNTYSYQWLYDELKNNKIPTDAEFVAKVSKTMEILTKTAFDIKSYLVDARFVMIAATTKFSTMFSNASKDEDE